MINALQCFNVSPQGLIETTIKGIPTRVLGSASYQVGKMDVLNVSDSSATERIFIWI